MAAAFLVGVAASSPSAALAPSTTANDTTKWDVETSLGFPRTVSFETDEGQVRPRALARAPLF